MKIKLLVGRFQSEYADTCGLWIVRDVRIHGASAGKAHGLHESDFHWQAKLAPGQTLEIIGRNGEIEANGAPMIRRK